MRNRKLSQDTLDYLEYSLKSVGKHEYFEDIKSSNTCQLRQSGEFMYLLLRLGYSPIEIDQLLDIRVKTIERRILEKLKDIDEEKDTYEAYAFLFENVTGFPWIDIYRLYMRSNFNESMFISRECIDRETFKKIKKIFSTQGAIKYENEIQSKKQENYKNKETKVKNGLGIGKRIRIGVAQFHKLA